MMADPHRVRVEHPSEQSRMSLVSVWRMELAAEGPCKKDEEIPGRIPYADDDGKALEGGMPHNSPSE